MTEDEHPTDGKGILHPEGMQAARDLAAGVVHEVNNILGVIIGNAHLAKKNVSNPAGVEKYLAELRDAAEEGRELMRHLAILAGAEPLRARVVSLNDLVNNAVAGAAKPVELDLSGEDPQVELDVWLAQDAFGAVVKFMADARSRNRVETSSVKACGSMPLSRAAFSTFWPCSSVPVKKRTSRPSSRMKRASASQASVV